MVPPYILFYDLCILTVAVAFLVRDGMSRGFLPGERTVILICFAALFFVQVPIGPVVCTVLFFLTVRRILAYRPLDQGSRWAAANFLRLSPSWAIDLASGEMSNLAPVSGALKSFRLAGCWIESRFFTEWRLTLYGSGATVVYFVVWPHCYLRDNGLFVPAVRSQELTSATFG